MINLTQQKSNHSSLPSFYSLISREQGFRPSSRRNWSRVLKNLYSKKCFISQRSEDAGAKLESHHLFAVNLYPHLTFSLLNGIVMDREFHLLFHRLYGNDVRPEQFLMFLDYCKNEGLLSSSQDVYILKAWINLLTNALQKTNI
jgi:hypothetical protein